MQPSPKVIPWRECAFASITETATILARSPDWVRDRIGEGRLRGHRLTPGGPLVVGVPSIINLIAAAEVVAPEKARAAPGHSRLYLAVDNTK